MRILITGATGMLGRHLVPAARRAGHVVRAQSRTPRSTDPSGVEWVAADIGTGAGLADAVRGVDTILHAASNPPDPVPVDVEGTKRLIGAALAASVEHLVYISIVGVDDIPHRYYRAKREAERIIEAAELPHTILRTTQFHAFVDKILSSLGRVPLALPIPAGFQVQSVSVDEVVPRLLDAVDRGPRGRLPDLGGPDVMTVRQMAGAWLEARGERKVVVPLPLMGAAASAARSGHLTVAESDAERGAVGWEAWLEGRYSRA